MQNWIAYLNDPLVLGGFVLLIFAGVFKLMLGKKNSAGLWNTALNYLFVLAMLIIGLAFFKTSSAPSVVVPAPVPVSAPVAASMSVPVAASPVIPTTIKQSTKGNNSAAQIEGVNLKNKNVEQSTRGNNSPAIIKGD